MEKKKQVKIEVGFRLGKLTVTEATSQRKNGYMVWSCRCDCGGGILLDTRTLQRGTVGDCGCEGRVRPGQRELSGRRFGLLRAMEPTSLRDSGGSVIWRCQCDCGNTCLASSSQLISGNKKSCGCLSHPPRKNLAGQQFGSLEVVAYAGKRGGMHRWLCRCSCGQETVVGQTLLQSGKTRSCGCLQTKMARENMRLCGGTSVTILETLRKQKRSNNTSGYTGVYLDKRTGHWTANITFKRKRYYLGTYDRFEDAVKARKKGEEMHDDFLSWYYGEYLQKNLGKLEK